MTCFLPAISFDSPLGLRSSSLPALLLPFPFSSQSTLRCQVSSPRRLPCVRCYRCSATIAAGASLESPQSFSRLDFCQDQEGYDVQAKPSHPKLQNHAGNGGYKTRTKKELVERIEQEERQKRGSDRASTPVVRAVTWACRGATMASEVGAIVADLDISLPIFTSVIQKLGFEGRPRAAVAVFQWLQGVAEEMRPNVYTYNSLLGALKTNGLFPAAQDVFQQMQMNSVTPDVVTFNTFISFCELQGLFDHALHLFNRLKALGLQPTLFTYRNVIQILGKKRDVEAALDVFLEFKQQQQRLATDLAGRQALELKRHSAQSEELDIIMAQLGCERFRELVLDDKRKGDEAVRFLNRLKMANVRLDAHAYERLIQACSEDGQEDYRVLKILYEDMRERHMQVTVSLCNQVIEVFGRCKKWWAALEVYEHMVDRGPEPNAYTYRLLQSNFHLLLNAASKRKIWKWALQLLDKMIEKGVEPDQFSWNSALVACAKARQAAAALAVFQRMTQRGHMPGIVSYGALLSAFEKHGSLPSALLVWEHMQHMGLKPNAVAYTTMISLYGKVGKYSEAFQLGEDMREAGLEPSLVTFNALITTCARAAYGQRALDVVEQMKAAQIEPDAITYSQLIKALANEGRWAAATAAYAEMKERNLTPPPYVQVAVAQVCKANNIPFDLELAVARPED